MKTTIFFFVTLLLGVVQSFSQSKTWTGVSSASWSTASNWSPVGVPVASDEVTIVQAANAPTIVAGITGVCKTLFLKSNSGITINLGGVLTVTNTNGVHAIQIQESGVTITNAGTMTLDGNSGYGILAYASATLTNSGSLVGSIAQNVASSFTFTNELNAVFTGDLVNHVDASMIITNHGTINAPTTSYYIFDFSGTATLTNDGTINCTAGQGIQLGANSSIANLYCGKILMPVGNYSSVGTTVNRGYIYVVNSLSTTKSNGFSNEGILKASKSRGPFGYSGNASLQINDNSLPIFTNTTGNLYNGTIHGIFTNATATITAGTYTKATNTFVPSNSLPTGLQTLYTKITPTGGGCTHIVPFLLTNEPEITLQSNNQAIGNNSQIFITTNNTNFGTLSLNGSPISKTYTIKNEGYQSLNLSGASLINISGTSASNFRVTSLPSPSIAPGSSSTFSIEFNPISGGVQMARISIASNDSNENPFAFSIQATVNAPEMNITGKNITIVNGDTAPSVLDDTDFGSIDVSLGSVVKTFTIQNKGTIDLNLTGTPKVVLGGANTDDFSVTSLPNSPIAKTGSTTFQITFDPTAPGLRAATISIANDDANENPYVFSISGTGSGSLSTANFEVPKFILYPNPVVDVLNIDAAFRLVLVEVFDSLGQKIISTKANKIDTTQLMKGVYFVKIEDENKNIQTLKVIK